MRKFIRGRWATFFKNCFKVYISLQFIYLASSFVFSYYQIESPAQVLSTYLKAKEAESLEKYSQPLLQDETNQQTLSDLEKKQLDDYAAEQLEKAKGTRKVVHTVFKWGLILFAGVLFLFVHFCCLLIPITIYLLEFCEKFKVYRKSPHKKLKDHFRFWLLGRVPDAVANQSSENLT